MQYPKPPPVHPTPVTDIADDDEKQSAHYERHDCEVQQQHRIRELLKDQNACDL